MSWFFRKFIDELRSSKDAALPDRAHFPGTARYLYPYLLVSKGM
jgi:hypothetical protein